MAIDWNDNQKRKDFRQALEQRYYDPDDLAMFVDEELNENLSVVAGGDKLSVSAFRLVQWARGNNKLDDVYQIFKKLNPTNPFINIIECRSLIRQQSNLNQYDWDGLFDLFLPDDLADLQRAFRKGFKQVFGIDFKQVCRNSSPLIELAQIRDLLESYDVDVKGPILTVYFVEFVIEQFKRSIECEECSDRDLTLLEQWRDRISQQFNVLPPAPPSPKQTACHGYLLVALEEIGSDVNVFPELHIIGKEKPVDFGAQPTTCSFNKVADYISQWILRAEDVLLFEPCDDTDVTLEVFLPCKYLEKDIATDWKIKNQGNEEIALGMHRRFLVRSSDRIRNRKIQKALSLTWQQLERSVMENNGCSKFHIQRDCPAEKGMLCALLKGNKATGLKMVADLPTDLIKRRGLLNDIIEAAIPIALWSSEMVGTDADALKTEFNNLLNQCNLTNFYELANRWQLHRIESPSAKPIRLLCDHPDRWPKLPDPNCEDHLLVTI